MQFKSVATSDVYPLEEARYENWMMFFSISQLFTSIYKIGANYSNAVRSFLKPYSIMFCK
jgi:hypothetical protein